MSDLTYGEYHMPDFKTEIDKRFSVLFERVGKLETFTGSDGQNGLLLRVSEVQADIKALEAITEDLRRSTERYSTKEELHKTESKIIDRLSEMDKARQQASRWRIDTVIAAVASIATLGMLIYMMANGG